MAHTELMAASDALDEAADHASSDRSAQLTDTVETLASLAEREPGPDHGRLARIEYTLRELKASADSDVVDRINTAVDHIKEYRKTVEGV
jgi:hypothetical protein